MILPTHLFRALQTLLLSLLLVLPASAQVETEEVISRREALSEMHPDGLIILPARWEEKEMEQPGWIQNPTFFYFTLLSEAPGALLVIDAPAGRSILFAPPAPQSFGVSIESMNLLNRPDLLEKAGIETVLPWDTFVTYVNDRIDSGTKIIYLDEPRRMPPSGVPEGMLAVSNFNRLWHQSLRKSFPEAVFQSAAASISSLRWIKSPAEIEILRRNAAISAAALRSGMRAIRPGISQRDAEKAVVSACLDEGAEGPSFWPWMMSGENARIGELVRSFYAYSHLNRTMQERDLVRADIGCASEGYGSDVGRTVPVSGEFSESQTAVWNLLITGYLAGIDAMAPGVSLEHIRQVSREAISSNSEQSGDLANRMAAMDGVSWHLHSIGIESGEEAVGPLAEGAVIAYEPMYIEGEDAFYLEDMILITTSAAEILTTGLPYFSDEMEAFLRR